MQLQTIMHRYHASQLGQGFGVGMLTRFYLCLISPENMFPEALWNIPVVSGKLKSWPPSLNSILSVQWTGGHMGTWLLQSPVGIAPLPIVPSVLAATERMRH